ncbi:MAG TPA: hypothetical protein VNT20_15600 [Flavisolibacter sp.]|jgi:hypothetical protein|nr:hypothetical protein [Flavisolibacter sp.]
MEEKQLSEQESLMLIQQMIQTAKQEQKDDGKGWILWGWMLVIASLLTVFNMRLQWFRNVFLFWNLFGAFTILYFIYTTIVYFFFRKTKRVKTYTSDLFARLNAGFFISLLFIILSINIAARVLYNKYGVDDGTPVRIGFALLINLYAFWVLAYGTALNFKPSIVGAYCTWLIGFAALFMKTFEQVMLLHALAVLVGYIVPGHIAYREFKKIHRKENIPESV